MIHLVLIGDDIAALMAEADLLGSAGYAVEILVKHPAGVGAPGQYGARRAELAASAITRFDDNRPSLAGSSHPALSNYAANRWAGAIAALVKSEADARTIAEWGHSIGVSAGALRSWCRSARVPARNSLVLARLLRGVRQSQGQPWRAEQYLDVADERTLSKMVRAGGIASRMERVDLQDVLQSQTLVNDADAIRALRVVLESSAEKRTAHLAILRAGSA